MIFSKSYFIGGLKSKLYTDKLTCEHSGMVCKSKLKPMLHSEKNYN